MPEPVEIPISWIGTDEVPIQFVNMFLGQIDDVGDVILSLGQLTPPAFMGDSDDMKRQAERMAFVPVRPVARISLSRERLDQLVEVLQQTQRNHSALAEGRRGMKGKS